MNLKKYLTLGTPYWLSIIRILVGILYLQHGTSILFGIPWSETSNNSDWLSFPVGISGILCTVLGTLITLGLFTRTSSLIATGHMFSAYIIGHVSAAPATLLSPLQNEGEPSILFALIFSLFIFTGAGLISIDRLFHRGQKETFEN